MKYNPSQEYLGKPLTNIIRVMRNNEFTTSPDRTTITPDNIGETIEKMDTTLTRRSEERRVSVVQPLR